MVRSVFLLLFISCGNARLFCDKLYRPIEVGKWRFGLKHLDSGVVENNPVSITEGQFYVYENDFPGYTITYIHVDNLAIRTCGATAKIKAGGVGKSTVLIVLHSNPNDEIRSVVDIWGVKKSKVDKLSDVPLTDINLKHDSTSLYLFKDFRTVNHNIGY